MAEELEHLCGTRSAECQMNIPVLQRVLPHVDDLCERHPEKAHTQENMRSPCRSRITLESASSLRELAQDELLP